MSFEAPEELHYLDTHEWSRIDDDIARIGITDFAQDELGDVIFVELPSVGDQFEAGEPFGVIESLKADSDLFTAVGGEVVSVNEELADAPELVNDDPYGDGWMVEIRIDDDSGLDETLSAEAYRELTE
ncbi:MAG: glycine cleavage system protein GcvH [Halobacteriota archaeon]